MLQAAFTFDCVDGQLARYTRTFTKLGAWLDSIFDRTKEYLVFAGLAIGASRAGDDVWLLAGAALTLQTARHAIDFSYPATLQQALERQGAAAARAARRRRRAPGRRGRPRRAPRWRRSRRRRRAGQRAWRRLAAHSTARARCAGSRR